MSYLPGLRLLRASFAALPAAAPVLSVAEDAPTEAARAIIHHIEAAGENLQSDLTIKRPYHIATGSLKLNDSRQLFGESGKARGGVDHWLLTGSDEACARPVEVLDQKQHAADEYSHYIDG